MSKERVCFIDGDIVAYRCAAANEKRTVVAKHKETLEELEFDTATDFKAWISSSGEDKEWYELVPKQTPGPIENAYQSVKTSLQNITEKAGCDSYHIVMSGDGNFRLNLPLPTRYKDSRKESTRPIQLKKCRDFLIKKYNAEISDGDEADALLVAYATQSYTEWVKSGRPLDNMPDVQASLDKDAKHGPFMLFDWTTMEEPELIEGYGAMTLTLRDTGKKKVNGDPVYEKIVKGKGRAFLWFQILFGDPVDCYKPCELAKAKFGEVGAYELLKDCKNDKEALEAVVSQYKRWYPKPVTYTAWDGVKYTKTWIEIMQMYADCAFMARWEGDKLDIKKLLDKLGIEYE